MLPQEVLKTQLDSLVRKETSMKKLLRMVLFSISEFLSSKPFISIVFVRNFFANFSFVFLYQRILINFFSKTLLRFDWQTFNFKLTSGCIVLFFAKHAHCEYRKAQLKRRCFFRKEFQSKTLKFKTVSDIFLLSFLIFKQLNLSGSVIKSAENFSQSVKHCKCCYELWVKFYLKYNLTNA